MKVHILGPRYNPLIPNKHHLEMEVNELYLLMGRALEPIDEIPGISFNNYFIKNESWKYIWNWGCRKIYS